MTDYKDLIKRLRAKATSHLPGGYKLCAEAADALEQMEREYNASGALMDRAADAIEELSMRLHGDEAAIAGMKREIERMVVAGKPRWIPVTERLPEQNTRVIGFMAWKGITAVEYQNGKWYSIDHLQSLPDEAVTHWMPLPEPPSNGRAAVRHPQGDWPPTGGGNMSIIIKGMEMPTEGEYNMTLYVCSDGSAYMDVASFPVDKDRFEAVPVPPHGDLIDRNALPWEKQGKMLTDPDEWGLKARDIEHAPTIIPADPAEEDE